MKKNNIDIIDGIWNFFTSMKVAVLFIILLAVVSIIGTLIPQEQTPELYRQIYSPLWNKIIITLGFNNLYNSFLYRFLLVILGINITVCSIEHLVNKIKEKKKICLPFEAYKSANFINFHLPFSSDNSMTKISDVLKYSGYKILHCKDGSSIHLYCEKGFLKSWGPFLVHISILIIFGGAIYGGFTGFKDNTVMVEVDGNNLYTEKHNNFQLKLKDFHLEEDGNHRLKQYVSEVEVIDNNVTVMDKVIKVNQPLEYKGVTFYQANWGMVGLQISVTDTEGKNEIYYLELQENGRLIDGNNFFALPNGWVVEVNEFYPDAVGPVPEFISPLPFNSAIRVRICKNVYKDKKELQWKELGYLYVNEARRFEGFTFRFDKVIEFSGLQVKKDPGVSVVYTGCFLMMIGMIIAFYTSRKIIRICLLEKSLDKTMVYIGFSGKQEDDNIVFLNKVKEKFLEKEEKK